MRQKLFIFFIFLSVLAYAQLPMGDWRMHSAYSNFSQVVVGKSRVYAVSEGALMTVTKDDHLMEYHNKLTGLSSANISHLCYDKESDRVVITYADGNIDLLDDEDNIINIADLYSSQTSENKVVNDISISSETAYLAMKFGIIQLDLKRKELKDTYYIGSEATAVDVKYITQCNDTLFALSTDSLYFAALSSNKIDYSNWETMSLPGNGNVMGLAKADDNIYVLRDSIIYRRTYNGWTICLPDRRYRLIISAADKFMAAYPDGIDLLTADTVSYHIPYFAGAKDLDYDATTGYYWFADGAYGVGVFYPQTYTYNQFRSNGPISNSPYRLRVTGNRLYMVQGGYGAMKNQKGPMVMYYENGRWKNYYSSYFFENLGYYSTDYSDILGDPTDPSHFFVVAYSAGLLEFRENEFYKLHSVDNSPFITMENGTLDPKQYTWTDGLVFDDYGNLFVLCLQSGLCMLNPQGEWSVIKNAATTNLDRCKQVLISNQNPNIKITMNFRNGTTGTYGNGIGVMDDRGTLYNPSDDKAIFRHDFQDQNGNEVKQENIYYIEQDLNGELWVGTNAGLFVISDVESLFTSNACRRIIIPRTDGSGLADYLLGDEQINVIAVDGANRKWIGTQSSGLYLMSADGTETIEHFTTDNSPIPSNTVLSIAINHTTGEVFVGTSVGLLSYQSDAAEAKEDFSEVYAYPNPVKENFEGYITISGLMENSTVNITDSSGQLVAHTVSLGSLAGWDGKNMNRQRVPTGVYFAQCVSADGKQYALVKILIIN